MNLPTMEDCLDIIEKTDAFFMTETVVEGQNVRMINYRLASLSDFVDNDAFELRGITFVQADNGTWERNILLQKFFNINQTDGWMHEDVKDKKITRVQNKEDGSIISFVKFGGIGGKVRAKSKMSFISEQAVMAQEIYDTDENLQKFISICIREDITPIFELVGMDNQIVLEYGENELILLQARDILGNYFSVGDMDYLVKSSGVKRTEDFEVLGNNTLEDLLHLKETSKDPIEGWVVTFEDGQMAKIKTDKYLSLHGLIGPDAFRENLLVQTILDSNIDDVISALVPGAKKDRIIQMDEKVTKHFNHLVVEFKELRRKYFQDFKEVRKDFALAHKDKELFSGVMKSLNTSFRDVEQTAEKAVKDHMLRQCNSLTSAKNYLDNL